jgi:hypothetical protein
MSLLFPAGLLLGLAAIPITALYFLRLRRRTVVVPSLLLWHTLQQHDRRASPFDRFRRHLLLLLQLLLLAALVLAVARPFLETGAAPFHSVVVVVDTTASMGSLDGERSGETRLDTAKRRASEAFERLGPSDEGMLIAAGARTHVLASFTRDTAALTARVADLTPTEAHGSLAEALQLAFSLARSRPDVEVLVLSDGGNEDLSSLQPDGAAVTFSGVGRAATNAGLLALDLRRSPTSELDRQLFVTAVHHGADVADGSVELYLDDHLLTTRTVRLPPDTPVPLVFDLDGGQSGVLRVHLDVPGDLLPADDEAFALLGAVRSRRIALVGGDALTARVLRADPRVQLDLVDPVDATAARLAQADAVLAFTPPPPLDGANIAWMSRKAGGPATLGALSPLPAILSWSRGHAVNRFVDYQGATVARAASVRDPAGLTAIVDSDAGPLMLVGERAGGRVLQLTFDPFETDLPLRVAWPVLVLNTVGWLTERLGGDGGPSLVAAGQPFVRPLPGFEGTASLRGPTGSARLVVADSVLRVVDTDRVGVYRIRAGDRSLAFAANLTQPAETRIRPSRALSLGTDAPVDRQETLRAGRRELWRPLLVLALLLLCLEWWAYHRRKTA